MQHCIITQTKSSNEQNILTSLAADRALKIIHQCTAHEKDVWLTARAVRGRGLVSCGMEGRSCFGTRIRPPREATSVPSRKRYSLCMIRNSYQLLVRASKRTCVYGVGSTRSRGDTSPGTKSEARPFIRPPLWGGVDRVLALHREQWSSLGP